MIVLKLLIQIGVAAAQIRPVRVMLYFCCGAVTKTLEAKVIMALPMDPYTRAVFVIMHFVVLFAFCIDLVNLVFENLCGVPLLPRDEQSAGDPLLKKLADYWTRLTEKKH